MENEWKNHKQKLGLCRGYAICPVGDGVVSGIEEDYGCMLVFVSLGRL